MLLNAAAIYIAWLLSCLAMRPTIFLDTLEAMIGIMVAVIGSGFVYQAFNVYSRPMFNKMWSMIRTAEANVLSAGIALILIVTLCNDDSQQDFMVIWVIIALLLSTAMLSFKLSVARSISRVLYKKQYILRKIIVIGDNTASAREYIRQIEKNPHYGMMIVGYVGNKSGDEVGCNKLGSFSQLESILDEHLPTDVVFAIDAYDKKNLIKLVNICDDRCIKVYFLPVIYGFFKSSRQLEQVGNLPVINIHTTPLDNRANAIVKRLIDIVGSIALIVLTAPLMIIAAIGTKISSPGPILFKQVRVGKMGKPFTMLKFRSMRADLGSDAIWTQGHDPRKTRFGTFLRRTAIDELPQLFNVLIGSMSLVGPRPELPKFVDDFRKDIPLYMIKHYVKPGITGLAQIKGLRGDTSVADRIHEDIDYIENWSIWLDFYILLLTPLRAFNKNEVYVSAEQADNKLQDNESVDAVNEAGGEHLRCEELVEIDGSPEENAENDANDVPKPKILYVASTYSHLKSFHAPYIKELRKQGYQVMTMAKGMGASFEIPFEKKIISIKNLKCLTLIKKILKKEQFDVIILNTTLAAFYVRLALPKKNRPRVVNIVHGYLFNEKGNDTVKKKLRSFALLMAEKFVAGKTDAVITMNSEDKSIALKNKLSSSEYGHVLGMGVPRRSAVIPREDIRREEDAEDKTVMLFVGELSSRKNAKFLISTMPAVLKIQPNAQLWLIGEGDEKEHLVAYANQLRVLHRVRFLGRKKRVFDYLKASDIYVSAAKSEGLPFNIVEAVGSGLTVIASDVKGQSDVLEGGAGILYKSESIEEYLAAIRAVCAGEVVISDEAKEEAYLKYSFDSVFEDTLEKIKKAAKL